MINLYIPNLTIIIALGPVIRPDFVSPPVIIIQTQFLDTETLDMEWPCLFVAASGSEIYGKHKFTHHAV